MSALIEALRDPNCYPHAVATVRVIETHISWLLLTGSYVYKIKKPVALGFVDFSTLERRRHFCHEELRLNRRLAPQLYLDVVPIAGSAEHPRIAGEGPPIEFAVRMREFAQDELLDRCLAQGRLSPEHIDLLADSIAGFHAGAAVAPIETRFGTPDALLSPALDNIRTIEHMLSGNGVHLRIAQLRHWTEQEHARLTPVFAARKRAGWIRECHGDLHLGNMALIDGVPTVFDCIEFNEDFRWIDVMSDMAFAVMDLTARGRADLANRLLNRYLETSGDYEGMQVLRFYLVYRALVRAKVDCIRARQSDTAPGAATGTWQDFLERLQLAEAFTRPRRAFIAIMSGLSGSGKTHASQMMLERTGAIRIRSDVERKRLSGLQARAQTRSGVGGGIYDAQSSDRTFDSLAARARTIVDAGYAVIVDAAFLLRARRRPLQALAQSLGVPYLIVQCCAPAEVLAERIAQRCAAQSDASEATLEVLRDQQLREEPLDDDERSMSLLVDTCDEASVDAMLAHLGGLAGTV